MSGFMSMLGSDPAGLFDMLFNLLIIAAVGGLWLMWARSMKRQKNVEDILAATSGQLEEATRHLEAALHEIKRLQLQEQAASASPPAGSAAATDAPQPSSHPMHAYRKQTPAAASAAARTAVQPDAVAQPVATPIPQAPASDAQSDVQRIIHLHKLGQSAEQIAAQMNMPLARINLLLRLHQQHAGGPVTG